MDTSKSPQSREQLTTDNNYGGDVVTTIRIAAPSAFERNDRQAVRSRSRRERPQKLTISHKRDGQDDTILGKAKNGERNMYQPDIESFVSSCIPGVSFGTGIDQTEANAFSSQRRTKSIRKRSLPLLSFLSSTHLAAAEKKRKKEEQARQDAIAEEQAKKALLLNPIEMPVELAESGLPAAAVNQTSKDNLGLVGDTSKNAKQDNSKEQQEEPASKVTTTMEKTSNILMPPLLKDFLNQLESCPR